jgi:hypothetical protein
MIIVLSNVFMLNVIMLNVIMLNVITPNVIMLNVIVLKVLAPKCLVLNEHSRSYVLHIAIKSSMGIKELGQANRQTQREEREKNDTERDRHFEIKIKRGGKERDGERQRQREGLTDKRTDLYKRQRGKKYRNRKTEDVEERNTSKGGQTDQTQKDGRTESLKSFNGERQKVVSSEKYEKNNVKSLE